MADKKISEMIAMTASEIANDDDIVISDTSAVHTKRAPISELATFFGISQEGQRDTVGAMFNSGTHSGVTVTYDDPNDKINIVLNGSVTDTELGHLNGVTSDIQTQFGTKANLASPTFTGNPIAPTQIANNNSTRIATTGFVQNELSGYASDTATLTNKQGNISQWTNDSGYITGASTSVLTNKTGSISQWTNNSGYITATSTNTLNNKTISGANNTISNVPYSALSSVDEDISSVSGSHNTIASAKAVKDYVDTQITGINELSEATDTNITSPSTGQILVHDGSDSFDNKTASVTLSGAVTGTANMSSTGAVSVATTIPNDTVTINGQAVALGGSATIPSVLNSGGTFIGEVHLNDNVKLSLGDASGNGDTEIFHDGNFTNIKQTQTGGTVRVLTDNFIVMNKTGSYNVMNMPTANAGIDFSYNGTKKFGVESYGIDVVGNVQVSGTVDGRNIAADGTKLNGIDIGAQVNVKSNWTESSSSSDAYIQNKPSLATVATSGSYTDLSNKPTIPTNNNQLSNGNGYITSFTNTTYSAGTGLSLSGTTFNNTITNNNQLTNGNGYVTTDTTYSGGTGISISGTTINRDALNPSDCALGQLSNAGRNLNGDFTASGNITAYSDKRLKSGIKTIDNALDKVEQMRGVTFYKDGALSSGVIAQEMEEVAPELVLDGEFKSVAYGNTVGYLIEAIKELKTEVEELKTKLCKCED